MHGVWIGLVAAMEACSTPATTLDVMEAYKLVLATSLQCSYLDKVGTFCSHNSHPMTFIGLSKDSCTGLLSSLLNTIYDNFRACSSPEIYLIRAAENENLSENYWEQKVLLVGAVCLTLLTEI
jgi:hypothetical protein